MLLCGIFAWNVIIYLFNHFLLSKCYLNNAWTFSILSAFTTTTRLNLPSINIFYRYRPITTPLWANVHLVCGIAVQKVIIEHRLDNPSNTFELWLLFFQIQRILSQWIPERRRRMPKVPEAGNVIWLGGINRVL